MEYRYRLTDAESSETLHGSISEELLAESLAAEPTGKVGAWQDAEGCWQYVRPDDESRREHLGYPVRTVYVEQLAPQQLGTVLAVQSSSMTTQRPKHHLDMIALVSDIVGDDGTGTLGICVEHALRDDPTATAEDIAAIVHEAEVDAAAEAAADAGAEAVRS